MDVNQVSGIVVDSATMVDSALGPGLLESAYEAYLISELLKGGLRVESQLPISVVYDGKHSMWAIARIFRWRELFWLSSSRSRWFYRSTRLNCSRIFA